MSKTRKAKFPNGVASAKEDFIRLRAEGHSYLDIAESLGVSRQCLYNWAKELSVDIQNAKTFKLDAIKAQYRMLIIHQVEVHSKLLAKLLDEIESRNFETVPTDKLLKIFMDYSHFVQSNDPKSVLVESNDLMSLDLCTKEVKSFIDLP